MIRRLTIQQPAFPGLRALAAADRAAGKHAACWRATDGVESMLVDGHLTLELPDGRIIGEDLGERTCFEVDALIRKAAGLT